MKSHILSNIREYLLLGFVALIVAGNYGLFDSDYRKGVKAFESSNYYSAQEYLTPLAMKGDRRAQFYIGKMFLEAYGVDKNEEIALKLLKKSADQNYRRAQYTLGYLYSKSKTIPRDVNKAILYYQQSDKQGWTDSTHMLSTLYFDNNLFTEDVIDWFKNRAKDNSNAMVQFYLGELYHTGKHIPQDFIQASKWYKRSVFTHNDMIGSGKSKWIYRHFTSDEIKRKCEHIKNIEASINSGEVYQDISNWYHINGMQLRNRCI